MKSPLIKIPKEILLLYRSVHSWVGIISGLFLFVAFYAGAISMFERPLQNYLSFQKETQIGVPLSHVPELLSKTFSAFPEAQKNYAVILSDHTAKSAFIRWPGEWPHKEYFEDVTFSTLDHDHHLAVTTKSLSQTAFFIDILHRQVGLPLPHKSAMIIMGIIALLYAVALVSAVIIYLPVLTKMLFAVRLDGGFRKKWLDFHNLLGFFSLPFHMIMAVTSVVFAFHGEFFAIEHALFAPSSSKMSSRTVSASHPPVNSEAPLDCGTLIQTLQKQAPGFRPMSLNYNDKHHQLSLIVTGYDPRYSHRGPEGTFIPVNPYNGKILSTDYLPGHQPASSGFLTSLFSLHFGSFGGNFVRWGYVLLGFGGAFLFYTGNHLWIEARRKQNRSSGHPQDSWETSFLERVTSSWIFGTITGISALFIISILTPYSSSYSVLAFIYYGTVIVFFMTGWLCDYPAANWLHKRGAVIMTLCVPVALFLRSVLHL